MTIIADIAHDTPARLGEGVLWSPADEALLWVDVEGRTVHHFDHRTATPRDAIGYDDRVSNIALRSDGGWALGLGPGVALTDSSGAVEHRIDLAGEPAGNRTNDGNVDPSGRLFIGTMPLDLTGARAVGALHRVDAGGNVERVVEAVTISNGIGWSPDETLMYYIDTATRRVDVFDYDRTTGAIEGRRGLITFDGRSGVPDGMCVDTDGCLWVALFGGGRVQRFSPSAEPLEQVEVPGAPQTTCCGFGGPDLDVLYITTARIPAMPGADAPHAGSLFSAEVDARGRAANSFAG
ncbi:MAG: SMP-30/gluconolactonase/LRE family protein [Acidimicrobiales bacterium]